MELLYKKDGLKNNMILKCESEIDNDYRLQMVINNTIPGILPMKIETVNNENQLNYNISSKSSLSNIFAKDLITSRDLEQLVISLGSIAKVMREYLLDINNIVLDMDFIFMDQKTNSYYFCYYPANQNDETNSLEHLFTNLVERLNHKDRESIIIGYGLLQIVQKENVCILDLVEFINSNRKSKESQKSHGSKKPMAKRSIETDIKIEGKEENSDFNENTSFKDNDFFEEDFFDASKVSKKPKKIKAKKDKKIKEKNKKEKRQKENKWWKFFKKEKPKTQQELLKDNKNKHVKNNFVESNDFMELYEKEDMTSPCEEVTILLSNSINAAGIVLRSTDIENPLTIIPNVFPCVIGKSKKSTDCNLDDEFISRVHARLYEEVDGYFIEDLNSTNGTYINGEKIKAHELESVNIGDVITLANMEFVIE